MKIKVTFFLPGDICDKDHDSCAFTSDGSDSETREEGLTSSRDTSGLRPICPYSSSSEDSSEGGYE